MYYYNLNRSHHYAPHIPHHEFWPSRLCEAPAYAWLVLQCLIRGIGFKKIFRCNYGVDHGGAGLASKFELQTALGADKFPDTCFISEILPTEEQCELVTEFARTVGYPLILKPDYGFTGCGVVCVNSESHARAVLQHVQIDYIAQQFVPAVMEFGVFYVRKKGVGMITAINQKHFPGVIGDGVSTIETLAKEHKRYNHFWQSYLRYIDVSQVLPVGEKKRLSFIGSHTLGCKFTEDTHLVTPSLTAAIDTIFSDFPGLNYGRLDVLTTSVEAFQAGEVTLIEVNGIDSVPTNIFDPKITLWQSYKIFFRHMTLLAQVSAEHRQQPMPILPLYTFIKRSKRIHTAVIAQQTILENYKPDVQ